MLKKFPMTTICLVASTSVVLAQGSATLQDKAGTVLVNSGTGFVQAAEGARLASTDRVMVQPRGKAFLVYADGCRTKLKPGKTVTVGTTSCAEGRELADLPNRAAAPVMPPVEAPVGAVGIGGAPLLLGGLALAGAGIGVAVALSNNGGDPGTPPRNGGGGGTPISP